MENLLPSVTAVDVTSNQFRETSLPYQQWEATRTHCSPSTPSDIAHLLPPIGDRSAKRDRPCPALPCIEPPLPCPAPVDRNLSDLYDPALDPSPIGMEQRGVVQPVRITRIVPRRTLGTPESRRGSKPSQRPGSGSGNTAVTILNGYMPTPTLLRGRSGDGHAEKEGACIDVFVSGLGTTGIDHATLHPSELFRRVLQTVPPPPPAAEEAPVLPEGPHSLDDKESSHGLTILLAGSEDWLKYGNGFQRTQRAPEQGDPHIDLWRRENGTSESANLQHVELPEENVVRLLFRREEDGTLAPSHNAFRVQFEPGPLGMELEEVSGDRGVVQIRQVLQAGQAEQDGRLFAGFLVVAVGDWEDKYAAATAMDNADPTIVGGFMGAASTDVSTKHANATTRPAVLRSLRELEEAVVRRDPNKLFFLWALDRTAPEAIAALGPPQPVASDARKFPRGWSAQPLLTEENPKHSDSRGSKRGEPTDPRYDNSAPYDNEALSSGGVIAPSSRTRTGGNSSQRVGTTVVSGGGAPGWESNREYANNGVGNIGDKCAFSRGEQPEVFYHDRASEGTKRVPPSVLQTEAGLSSIQGFPLRDPSHPMSATPGAEACRPNSTTRITGECFSSGEERGWDFETGGGIFDDDDQGLAARKQPLRHNGDDAEEPVNDRPPLPLGLEASTADEFSVFIWFSNNHESAVMQVSWIDYDGKLVPRRSLAPGACYFERSFATHPWVIQQQQQQQPNDTPPASMGGGGEGRDCCVIRLGDVMAVARLTGSLIWNPSGKTLSVTKQAKVGVTGMSASALAAVGSGATEGAGVAPGKKKICVAGAEREAEATRAKAERASVRREKARILEEMRTWRRYPPGNVGVGGDCEAAGGLGQGAPNLRVVMVGSSGLRRWGKI